MGLGGIDNDRDKKNIRYIDSYLEDWGLHASSLEVASGVAGREVDVLLPGYTKRINITKRPWQMR